MSPTIPASKTLRAYPQRSLLVIANDPIHPVDAGHCPWMGRGATANMPSHLCACVGLAWRAIPATHQGELRCARGVHATEFLTCCLQSAHPVGVTSMPVRGVFTDSQHLVPASRGPAMERRLAVTSSISEKWP